MPWIEEVMTRVHEPIKMGPKDQVLRTRAYAGFQSPDIYYLTILRYEDTEPDGTISSTYGGTEP